MTTFIKNPYSEVRKKLSFKIFNNRLDKTLDDKFKHKKFSERFAMANASFLGLGFIAQIASLTTAFTMLSFLFENINIIVRVACSIALVIAIELIKRESTNDVMKGLFQYKEIERFPTLLALIAVSTSIYISVEGAKILPSFFIADAVEEKAILKTPNSIKEDFNNRIADKTNERNQARETRLWQGRLKSDDAEKVEEHNEDIKALQAQKDEALKELNQYNEAAKIAANVAFQKATSQVKKERAELSKTLVITAIVFEVLFVLCTCFSWWYYTECRKERVEKTPPTETSQVTTKDIDKQEERTTQVTQETSQVTTSTTPVTGEPRQKKKPSFIDYEEVPPETSEVTTRTIEVDGVKQEYTRVCPICDTKFVHKNMSHKYCKRSCMLEARKKRLKG
ncbi:hypothetical protein [Aureispira sp. CCB-QB1]|uniref:hypothetical protein n=1 Tax=Aureispira sp. CCB-QB1 TaxID=1313421 RepID=UPI0012DE7541|nr:hypothetical protein [Aureispira sp. CCB-QB1]